MGFFFRNGGSIIYDLFCEYRFVSDPMRNMMKYIKTKKNILICVSYLPMALTSSSCGLQANFS